MNQTRVHCLGGALLQSVLNTTRKTFYYTNTQKLRSKHFELNLNKSKAHRDACWCKICAYVDSTYRQCRD